ncbi:MAG: hypothetical protein V1905_00315 [bacterium]
MVNQQLIEYIKGELSKRVAMDDIKSALIKVGWPITDIEDAILAVTEFNSTPLPPTSSPEPLVSDAYSQSEDRGISSDSHTFSSTGQSSDDWFKGVNAAPKRERTVIIVAVLAFLLIAAGVLAYTYYSQIPGIVLKKMAGKIESVKTMAFSGEVNASIEMNPKGTGSVGLPSSSAKITMDGAINVTDEKNPDLSMKMDTTSGIEGIMVSFGMEMRMIKKIMYFKISEFPMMETLGVGDLKDQWIMVDIAAIAQKYNLEELEKQFNAQGLLEKMTPEQKKQIEKMWNDEIVKSAKNIVKMKDEKINGVNSYHYQIPLDKNTITDLTMKTIEILGAEVISAEEKTAYTEAMGMMEYDKINLWVGKKDNLPTKMTFDIILNFPDDGGKYTLNYSFIFKDYNKAVAIEAPLDSKPVEEIIETLIGAIDLDPTATAASAADKSAIYAMERIANEAETMYLDNGSYKDLSCSGSSSMIKDLCDEIDKIMGGYPLIRKPAGTKPQSYCAVIILKEMSGSNKQYYCIDSTSTQITTLINPTISSCTKVKFNCPRTTAGR